VSEAGTASGTSAAEATVPAERAPGTASRARHWVVFFGLAIGVVVVDQLVKAWVVASFPFGEPVEILGEWLRVWYVANTGALFGLFRDQAVLVGVLSIGVMALIVWYHGRAVVSNGWLATAALGLLLAARRRQLRRPRPAWVRRRDFVDMGIPAAGASTPERGRRRDHDLDPAPAPDDDPARGAFRRPAP
jgi:hypothetical protein